MSNLVENFQAFSAWRTQIGLRIARYRGWLVENELLDARTDSSIQLLLDRLADDKLNIAFVAEFSRGKSELINAIFFADYGKRLLPSSAGRTTMCPTELLFDPSLPPCIRLLPIETRATQTSTTEYKHYAEEWTLIPLDMDSADAMLDALSQVSYVKRVPADEAKRYGLYQEGSAEHALNLYPDGTLDIPRWRHAVINFPHPLLQQGLVILDTPGLNAIGTEPELTLNLLPNADAILFILAADTGVTKSDIEVWREHISPGGRQGRMVVLNKIDGLWDELRSGDEIAAEIDKQVAYCARMLGVDSAQVFPISAQKAMVAKVRQDAELLARSRLPLLESALSGELIPAKREIVRAHASAELADLVGGTCAILEKRRASIGEQLAELRELSGKNQDVIVHMMARVKAEKENFERGLARFQALRGVFSHQSNTLFTHLGMDALAELAKRTWGEMTRSKFTVNMRSAMALYFTSVHESLDKSADCTAEILSMMEAMYRKFSHDHGLRLGKPTPLSMQRYQDEIARLEKSFNKHFNTLVNMVANEQFTLTDKFFGTLASQVKRTYEFANRETENWLKSIMAPLETQVREHQQQLRRRLESIKRIHQATDTLEDRVAELQHMERAVHEQIAVLVRLSDEIASALAFGSAKIAKAA